MKRSVVFLLIAMVATAMISSCGKHPDYPVQLVEADSAFRWGNYDRADSLLAEYDRHPTSGKESAKRYRQLVGFGVQFGRAYVDTSQVRLVHHLVDYFDHRSTREEHAKALLFLGDIYHTGDDYPDALNYYLQAAEEAEKINAYWLLGIIYKKQGDIYFDQRMYDKVESDKCVKSYRRSYEMAELTKDTLRLVYAAFYVGNIYTLLNDSADTIIHYYNKSIKLGEKLPQSENIVPFVRRELADIYLQMEEFDKAAALMPRDSLNNANWAYWHYQQEHTDSALYYFKKSLEGAKGNVYAQGDFFRKLAQLERKKGNIQQAFNYYEQCLDVSDSLIKQTRTEETRRTEARFNMNAVTQELDEAVAQRKDLGVVVSFLVALLMVMGVLVYREIRLKQKERDEAIAHEKLLRQEEELKHRQSITQIEENNRKIEELNRQLEKAQQISDELVMHRLRLDTEKLTAENRSIQAGQRRRAYLLQQLQDSMLYQRIKLNAGKPDFHLTNEEWSQLSANLDEVYDNFTNRLLTLAPFSEVEIQVCCLLKLEVSPAAIAVMLFRTKTSITMIRQRMGEKIFRRKNITAKDFDTFILEF